MKLAVRLFLPFVCCAVSVWASPDPDAGKARYAVCAACHGSAGEGNATMNAPVLAGLDAVYLERQRGNFRAGIRGSDPADTLGAQMRGMAATLPDQQSIADVSAYIATFAARPVEPAGGADLRNGSNFYQSKCGACHGGRAEGNAALFAPRLAGQDISYLKRQYRNFGSGLRGTHPDDRYGKQMKFMATSLPGEKDLDDVLEFIHAQGAAR